MYLLGKAKTNDLKAKKTESSVFHKHETQEKQLKVYRYSGGKLR